MRSRCDPAMRGIATWNARYPFALRSANGTRRLRVAPPGMPSA
jgi:hypothetical protein